MNWKTFCLTAGLVLTTSLVACSGKPAGNSPAGDAMSGDKMSSPSPGDAMQPSPAATP